MLPGRRSPNGSIFITETVPASYELVAGIAVSQGGALWVTDTEAPDAFVHGVGVKHDGRLCVNYGGPIAKFAMGLPFTDDGRLVCQLNQAITPSEPFVGGIRVGPLGGIYTIDLTPPPEAYGFSNGFSTGFDVETV